MQLGIAASYDAPDYDWSDDYDGDYDGIDVSDDNDIPSTGGFDPHRDNAGGEYDLDPNFRLDSAEPSLDESQMGE